VRRLWYVAYGSNLSLARFRCYLGGGRPRGSARSLPGSRDPIGPVATVSLTIVGGIYFAGRSSVWGGGMALFDPGVPSRVAARAYLLSAEQFLDVLAQEVRRSPGASIDPALIPRRGQRTVGPGVYETLVSLGERDGFPLVTFTCDPHDHRDLAAPSAAYLHTIAGGLRESHGWSSQQIAAYLAAAPGARGTWSQEDIEHLVG
jgi:hypothetical protein